MKCVDCGNAKKVGVRWHGITSHIHIHRDSRSWNVNFHIIQSHSDYLFTCSTQDIATSSPEEKNVSNWMRKRFISTFNWSIKQLVCKINVHQCSEPISAQFIWMQTNTIFHIWFDGGTLIRIGKKIIKIIEIHMQTCNISLTTNGIAHAMIARPSIFVYRNYQNDIWISSEKSQWKKKYLRIDRSSTSICIIHKINAQMRNEHKKFDYVRWHQIWIRCCAYILVTRNNLRFINLNTKFNPIIKLTFEWVKKENMRIDSWAVRTRTQSPSMTDKSEISWTTKPIDFIIFHFFTNSSIADVCKMAISLTW